MKRTREEVAEDVPRLSGSTSLNELLALDKKDGVRVEYKLTLPYSFEIVKTLGE